MIKKLVFVVGAGVGYVLGTRAGRQQYEAMVAKAREVAHRPDVQEVAQAVKSEANRLYGEGRQRLRSPIETAPPHTAPAPILRPTSNGTAPTTPVAPS